MRTGRSMPMLARLALTHQHGTAAPPSPTGQIIGRVSGSTITGSASTSSTVDRLLELRARIQAAVHRSFFAVHHREVAHAPCHDEAMYSRASTP
jgi:hypothetical protein